MKKLLSTLLMIFSVHAYSAPLYVKLESDGDIIFSNTPIIDTKPVATAATNENTNKTHKSDLNAKPVVLQDSKVDSKPATLPNIIPIASVVKEQNILTTQKSSTVTTSLKYKIFSITSPLDKEIIQNQSALVINLNTEPKLQKGDQIHLFIDGKHISKTNHGTHIDAAFTKKGSHEIYALIADKNKNTVIQSNVITIYIRDRHKSSAKPIETATAKISKRNPGKKPLFVKNC